ncbi:MAG: FHA domain-containing protein [Pseudomonadota bacterium]
MSQETRLEPLGGPVSKLPLPHVIAWFEFPDDLHRRVTIDKGIFRIGRHETNDFCLRGPAVHSHHAIVRLTSDGVFVIADLNERDDFGIFVNGVQTKRTILYHNDQIKFGGVCAQFKMRHYDVEQLDFIKDKAHLGRRAHFENYGRFNRCLIPQRKKA